MRYLRLNNGLFEEIYTSQVIPDEKLKDKNVCKIITERVTVDEPRESELIIIDDVTVKEIIYEVPVSLDSLKEDKKREIRMNASEYILGKYPDYKQRNAVMLIYGKSFLDEMINEINRVRDKVTEYDALVDEGVLDFGWGFD